MFSDKKSIIVLSFYQLEDNNFVILIVKNEFFKDVEVMNLPKACEKELIKYKTRQGRKKANFVVVEGQRCCSEVLKSQKRTIRYLLSSGDQLPEGITVDFPIYSCSEAQFESLSFTENSQGLMLVVEKEGFSPLSFSDPFLLVLDGLQEPGNVGTILRTAQAVGLKEVALTKGTVDPFNPKSIRAGMGAQFSMNFSYYNNIKDLVEESSLSERKVWLTTPHSGLSCYSSEFNLKDSILVFGEEGGGIQDFSTGQKVAIPMPGKVESLNVAQAVTIFLFEGVRQGLFTS